jgi:hypothetical protein
LLKKDKRYYTGAFLLTLLIISGCGLFETRDPEPPETIRSTYTLPTSADIVIDNLTFSIAQKNSENYNKSISSSSFQFIPDSKSQQVYKLIFSGWNQAAEKKYLDNLILVTSTTSSSVLFLDEDRLTQITPDSAVYQATYIIVFQHNQANIPKSARGNLTINIATDDDDLFYIRKWEDFRQNDTDFTWSELKANFSN